MSGVLRYLPDSNALSGMVRRVPSIATRFDQTIQLNCEFVICPLVYFEVRRGLEKIDASRQLTLLERLITLFDWNDLVRDDWRVASRTWALLQNQGLPIGDIDILIGVFASRRGATVITRNVRHFQFLTTHLPLQIENWFDPTQDH